MPTCRRNRVCYIPAPMVVGAGHGRAKALPYRSAWEFAVGAGFIPARRGEVAR